MHFDLVSPYWVQMRTKANIYVYFLYLCHRFPKQNSNTELCFKKWEMSYMYIGQVIFSKLNIEQNLFLWRCMWIVILVAYFWDYQYTLEVGKWLYFYAVWLKIALKKLYSIQDGIPSDWQYTQLRVMVTESRKGTRGYEPRCCWWYHVGENNRVLLLIFPLN